MNQELGSWGYYNATRKITHDDDEDAEEDIVYDDDEDEFGLPSIASMRKTQGRDGGTSQPKSVGPHVSRPESKPPTLGLKMPSNRQRANSSDIAEERDIPLYPTARKGDGKILRPQYKEILRGMLEFLFSRLKIFVI